MEIKYLFNYFQLNECKIKENNKRDQCNVVSGKTNEMILTKENYRNTTMVVKINRVHKI